MPGETPNAPPGPQVKPPTAAPGRAALLRPPLGSPALLRPPPGFHLPSCALPSCAPSGFHLPSCAPLLPSCAPLLGFTCPPSPPARFHLPSCPPSWVSPALLRPRAGFHLPSCAPPCCVSPALLRPLPGFHLLLRPPPGFHLPSRSPPSRVSPALPRLGPSHNITKTALNPKPCLWSKMSNEKTNTMSNLTTRRGPGGPGGGWGTLELQRGGEEGQHRALLGAH